MILIRKTMKKKPNTLCRPYNHKVAVIIVAIMLITVSNSFAYTFPENFMLDDHGNVVQISIVAFSKKFTLGKGFPITASSKGLLLTNFDTGTQISKFKPADDNLSIFLMRAYALDRKRIVLGFLGSVGIWNMETNKFVLHKGKGGYESGYGIQLSSVHPDENLIISCPRYGKHGLFLHDLVKGTSTQFFNEYDVFSPMFSPDGSRYAFWGRLNGHSKDEKHQLIIQELFSQHRYVYDFNNDRHVEVFSWSPSGKYIAGIDTYNYLYIWDNKGKVISCLPMAIKPEKVWAPLWMADKQEIAVFYIERLASKDGAILKRTFSYRDYGLL
jgi:WD40 repeat protein